MKMIKLLPILLTSALLVTGCTGSKKANYDVKKYKNEVTHAEFYQAFTKGMDEVVKMPEAADENLFDYTAKGTIRNIVENVAKIDGKANRESNIEENISIEAQYDADNVMSHVKGDAEMVYKVKMNYGEMDGEAVQKTQTDFYAKQTKVDDSTYKVDYANARAKDQHTVTNTSPSFAVSFLGRVSEELGYSGLPLFDEDTFNSFSEEVKAQFKFYDDKGVLTVVYSSEGKEETTIYKGDVKTSYIAQMTFKTNKFSFVVNSEENENCEYLVTTDEYVAGEKAEIKYATYYNATLDMSPVTLDFDYSAFSDSEQNYSINYMFPSLGF